MNLILSVVNGILKVIAWGIAAILGLLAAILVVTVMSIAYSISEWAGLALLELVILVVWMIFYAQKD